jgi:hypothetical protein
MSSKGNPIRPARRAAAKLSIGAVALALASAVQAAGGDRADRREQETARWCAGQCDRLVIDWNVTAYQVIKAADDYADPMAASRVLAMVHLAMHDAVNAVRPRFATWTGAQRDAGADPAIAAAGAAHDVLAALYPKQQATLKVALDSSLLDAGNGDDVTRGLALGKRVATAVLQRRASDGADRRESYREGTRPGEYRYTPGFDFLAAPHWGSVQPFALRSPSQFRTAPPPALAGDAYAREFNEVKAVGSNRADAKRTPDETHYAAWWYEFSDIGWNRVARVVSREHRQDLWERARTFALLNVAMADSYIAGWDSKMHYNFWRPVTAIRAAATDGNPNTTPDAGFAPLMPTPPVQDHPSTHSALGAAAAAVLAHAFGRDGVKFTMSSTTAPAGRPVREFASFSQAARENADSRVKAGIHFRSATVTGLKLGEDIGRYTIEHHLGAVD